MGAVGNAAFWERENPHPISASEAARTQAHDVW